MMHLLNMEIFQLAQIFQLATTLASGLAELMPSSGTGKAILASILLGASCGMLGCFVVVRRMALMGDAVSHAVLPGVVAGLVWSVDRNPFVIFTLASISGILGAGVVQMLMKTTRLKSDAALGIVLAVFFAAGVVWQSKEKSATAGVLHFLYGNASSIDQNDLLMMLVTSVLIAVVVWLLLRPLLVVSFDAAYAMSLGYPVKFLNALFYTLLSFSVVVALQAVGVILVSAMLITPAATAYLLTDRFKPMLLWSMTFGILSGLAGCWVSMSYNKMSTGSVIALAATAFFALFYFVAPRHGILVKYIRVAKRKSRTHRENLLKEIYSILERKEFARESVSLKSLSERRRQTLEATQKDALILQKYALADYSEENRSLQLSEKGWRRAMEIVRNHRLWELYLTRQADYAEDHVHDDAEKIEHVLGAEIVEMLERDLDFPEVDPHGKPIPRPQSEVVFVEPKKRASQLVNPNKN
ncbi:iron chelate uptake ABC transporter family permease subunit [Persicirhabdus sediminis]|nr:iron chelate uptake ABC transporter family permease subunit [Persicirhabdus sediminis]